MHWPQITSPTMTRNVVLLLNPGEAYDSALLRGIASFSAEHGGWHLFRSPPFWEAVPGWDEVGFVRRCRADGVILIERPHLRRFFKLGVPMVVSPYRQPAISGCANIVTDHLEVGRRAARHLMERGFEQFAFCGYPGMFWSDERGEGFRQELARAGRAVSGLDVATDGTPGYAKREDRLRRWLARLPRPCGLFAAIDARALQIAELCALEGIPVPTGIAILGVNNDELLCNLAPTPLSSVAIGAEKAGKEAARALESMMAKPGRQRYHRPICVHPTHVETRASTDFLHLADPVVVRALRAIQARANGPVRVTEIAREAGVSRRALELRFRRILARSVYREIRRCRIEAFAACLRKSTLTISEIGDRLGFPGPAHVSRVFKAETGQSPSEYRRRLRSGA